MWHAVSGFMVMGLVYELSLANHSHSGSFLVALEYRSAKMDSSEKDSGRFVGHMDWLLLSPFHLSQILPVGGSLLVLSSLPGPPVVR